MKKDFFADYKRPEWQKFRLEVLQYHDFACQYCGDDKSQLHAHHFYYKKDSKPWDYNVEEMRCLCESCHEDEHSNHIVTGAILGERSFEDGKNAVLSSCAEYGGSYKDIVSILEVATCLSLTAHDIWNNAMVALESRKEKAKEFEND
jgi:hypothetical protein